MAYYDYETRSIIATPIVVNWAVGLWMRFLWPMLKRGYINQVGQRAYERGRSDSRNAAMREQEENRTKNEQLIIDQFVGRMLLEMERESRIRARANSEGE